MNDKVKKIYYEYINDLYEKMQNVDLDELYNVLQYIKKCSLHNNTLFLIGNGGSASTCSHMANDIGYGVYKRSYGNESIRVISLAENLAINTAIANDEDYVKIFVRQLEMNYKNGDVLLVISVSGKSKNVLAAAKWVKEHNGVVLSFTGIDGGEVKELSDACIHIESDNNNYGVVEDIHLMINHIVSLCLVQDVCG